MKIRDIVSQNEVIVLVDDQMLISYIDCFYKVYFQVNDEDNYEYTQAFEQKNYVPDGVTDGMFHINMIKMGSTILAQKINKGEIEL